MGLDYKEFSTVATKKEFKSIIGAMCEMKKSNQTLLSCCKNNKCLNFVQKMHEKLSSKKRKVSN